MKAIIVIAFLLAFAVLLSSANLSVNTAVVDQYRKIASCGPQNASAIYEVVAKTTYSNPVHLMDLHGTRYEQGFCWSVLSADLALQAAENFLAHLTPLKDEREILLNFCLEQWEKYLSQQVPESYLEELQGIEDGAEAAGLPEVGLYAKTFLVLSNLPGLLTDGLLDIFHREKESTFVLPFSEDLIRQLSASTAQCDMFGLWGKRSVNGDFFGGRNLDWLKSSGIAESKIITIFHPSPDETIKHAYAIVGFAGLWGSLAGMSSAGITAHQDNLNNKEDTFLGYPWPLRIREVLGTADNLKDTMDFLTSTNTTVSVIHGFGSQSDAENGNSAMLVVETMAEYSSYYFDNEQKEANAVWTEPLTHKQYHIGTPLPQALWRSNHALDAEIMKTQTTKLTPTDDSEYRYKLLHDSIVWLEQTNQQMGVQQALNLTALLGKKGKDFFSCNPQDTSGTNIMSITFHPKSNTLWASWEEGLGDNWSAAACQTYIEFDLSQFFSVN